MNMKMTILLYHFMVRKGSTGDFQLDSSAAMLQKQKLCSICAYIIEDKVRTVEIVIMPPKFWNADQSSIRTDEFGISVIQTFQNLT